MLLFITTGMKIINSPPRPFRLWNSSLTVCDLSTLKIGFQNGTLLTTHL